MASLYRRIRTLARAGAWVFLVFFMLGCGEDTAGDLAAGEAAGENAGVVNQEFEDPSEQTSVGEEQVGEQEIGEGNGEGTEEEGTEIEPAESLLRVDGVLPEKGSASGGDTVTILGAGFAGDAMVLFDESQALNVFVLGEDRINVTTPPHAPGLARITVTQSNGEEVSFLDDAYLYANDVSIAEISPPQGPASGGTPVTVKGSGFTADTKLLFGEQLSINTEVVDDGTILALTPTGMPGEVDVFVSNNLGLSRLKKGFLYTAPPVVDKVVPVAGPAPGGEQVVIEGAGFVEPVGGVLGCVCPA